MSRSILQSGTLTISKDKSPSVIILDDVDCNMTFTFRLVYEPDVHKSYTKYVVFSREKAEVQIINSNSGVLHPVSEIEVGTYQNKYRLFVNFILAAQEDGSDASYDRKLDYVFFISE